ncbi:MAG: hypothetical protein ACXWCZ_07515 [Flavisolibacter sp.]
MKKIFLLISVIGLLITPTIFLSFKSKTLHYADLWQQLGVTEIEGTERIRESFLTGYLLTYGVKNFKNIVVNDRKTVTTDLLNYTKNYVQTQGFSKAYETKRLRAKPRDMSKKPKTEDQIREEKIAETKKAIANYEKSIQTTTAADIKKVLEDGIQAQKKQLAEYQDHKNEMISMIAKTQQQQYETAVKRYEDDLKKWEQDYPAEPSKFIKARLQQVLSATENIDYNAELIERNGKKYFVIQEYEKKNKNWKYGFRAGKEVTETVRSFVQNWLSQL